MEEATTTPKVDYFRMPRPLWRKLKKYLPRRRTRRGRTRRAADRGLPRERLPTPSGMYCGPDANGRRSIATGSRSVRQCRTRTFAEMEGEGHILEKLMRRMADYYYAIECGGVGWKWQAMDSKHAAAPLGGEKTGGNPTDRGKLGAKINLINLMVDERGAPLSVVLTGANRHDTRSRLSNSSYLDDPKAPGAQREQHLCADNKAYDAQDLREFATFPRATHHTHQEKGRGQRL